MCGGGGMHGRGHAWWGCMAGGMHGGGCMAGGHVWGGCMAGGMHGRGAWGMHGGCMYGRVCVWLVGGVHGSGMCMVGGMCGGGHAWQEIQPLQRTVCILLECILVEVLLLRLCFCVYHKGRPWEKLVSLPTSDGKIAYQHCEIIDNVIVTSMSGVSDYLCFLIL